MAKDRGFLYEICKDGKTSWLFGTIHSQEPAWAALGPTLRRITEQVTRIALEIDPASTEVVEGMKAVMAAVPRNSLSADAARLLREAAKGRCQLPDLFVNTMPAFGLFFLETYERRSTGMFESLSMEQLLARQAKATNKLPLLALETFETQRRVVDRILFAKTEVELIKRVQDMQSGKTREVLKKLANAWANSDSKFFESYDEWCECRDDAEVKAFMDELNGKRNKGMVGSIERLHKDQAGSILYAVGALHLFLADSMPDLLKKEGFDIKPGLF